MDSASLKELREIPGIGKSLAKDLWNLGIHAVADLQGKNPMQLYHKLNAMTGVRQDPCVLYTFRCAVYFATEKKHDPEKLKWWYWKDKSYKEYQRFQKSHEFQRSHDFRFNINL